MPTSVQIKTTDGSCCCDTSCDPGDYVSTYCLSGSGFTGVNASLFNNRQFVIEQSGCVFSDTDTIFVTGTLPGDMISLFVQITASGDGSAVMIIGIDRQSTTSVTWATYTSGSFGTLGGVFSLTDNDMPLVNGSSGGTPPATLTVSPDDGTGTQLCNYTSFCDTSTVFCFTLVTAAGTYKFTITYAGQEDGETGWEGAAHGSNPSSPNNIFRCALAISSSGNVTVWVSGTNAATPAQTLIGVYEGSIDCSTGGTLSLSSSAGKILTGSFPAYTENDWPASATLSVGSC